ncbi:MAG TPA: methyltransferase domain-containing protein [Candidatus Sulfotelmatobacter sp.]|nr:methyltransferase domain-containing protein [Candidatus Sulfotelmatobacter sp.]
MSKQSRYSWNAQDYAKHSSTQFEWAQELIPKLNLTGNEALLDIGCGDGKISAQIASFLPKGYVVGIDNSDEMINLAHHNFPRSRFPNLSFLKMDAQQLTFKEQFDRVFSNAALHWIIDHRPMLAGVKQSLKHDGKLLFQMGGKGNAHDILKVLDELVKDNHWRRFFEGFTFPYGFYEPNEYRAWLREAGLKPERVELITKNMKLNKESLAGWIRTTWLPYTQKIPNALQNMFITEIIDRYIEKHPADSSGTIHIAMVRLEVEACRP